MLKLEGVRLPPGGGEAELRARAAKLLRLRPADLRELRVLRRSVDAREDVALTYTLAVDLENEAAVLRRCRGRKIGPWEPGPVWRPPEAMPPRKVRPVVAGAGPAGLFAALVLAEAGQRPILLERGRPVREGGDQRPPPPLHPGASGLLRRASRHPHRRQAPRGHGLPPQSPPEPPPGADRPGGGHPLRDPAGGPADGRRGPDGHGAFRSGGAGDASL